ncbi:MAG: methyltransferase domain-containing protein [Desulfobacterales bacterium]|uniref:Methyltransferase domain-containing protein n=1 Tax=Candidatus Desulfatibia vada TaxID=2841696 RepID=A0A8J6P3S6_9BACT|nr:methyltransferase domain-containing protein [Candidatus Desulfatibia vada]
MTVEVSHSKGSEIVEGTLSCACGKIFPIIGNVPRFLCGTLKNKLPELYSDFFNRHPSLLDRMAILKDNGRNTIKEATMDRFGYEWEHFSDYSCDNFQLFIAPLPDDFFKGKLGLDVGCGAGRHAVQACELGAEVIGVDLSPAVDAAQRNTADKRRIHIVQADIYNLPFKPDIFHFIYSLGVLQHLSEPESGYKTLLPFLSKGGALFVWIYAYAARKVALEILRVVSQKLSNNNIRRMAYLCNLFDYGIFINLYRLTENLPFWGELIKRFSPLRVKEYATYGFRVGYTDWYDRLSAPITNYYKEDEMQNWLKHSGLGNTKLLPIGDSWWWLYGEKKALLL